MAIMDKYSKSKADLSQYVYGKRGKGGLLSYADRGTTSGMNTENLKQIYGKAQSLGVGASDVDKLLKLEGGTTSRWTKEQGLADLATPNLAGASGVGFGPARAPGTPTAAGQTPTAKAPDFGPVRTPVTRDPAGRIPLTPTPTGQAPTARPTGLLGAQPGAQRSSSMYDLPEPDPTSPYGLPYLRPNVRDIDPATETVQGQLAQIQREDSDLMQLAARRGREQAAQRGLLDSSLAAQSAQLAVLQEATPIAQQDAAAYMKQALANQQYENEFLGRIQGASIDMWVNKETGKIDTEKMKAEYGERLKLQSADYADKAKLLADEMGLKGDQEGGKQNAALWAQYIRGVTDINTSDMDLADKQAQIEQLKNTTLSSMAANARYFNNPDMMDFYVDQVSAIDEAMGGVPTGGQQPTTNEAGVPTARVGEWTVTYDDGTDAYGRPFAVIEGRRYYPGEELPSPGDVARHMWTMNQTGPGQVT